MEGHCVVGIVTKLQAKRPRNFSSIPSRGKGLIMPGLIQPPIQLELKALPRGKCGQADHSPHPLSKLRVCRTITRSPSMASCDVQISSHLQYIIFNSPCYSFIMKITFSGFQINAEQIRMSACHKIKSNSNCNSEHCGLHLSPNKC